VRKSCSFSKALAMHTARIKIVIDNYNRNIILD
jgi:insertion element IS1 protein InsB